MQRVTRPTGGTAALPSSVTPPTSATNNSAAAPAPSAGSWAFATRRAGSGGSSGSSMGNTNTASVTRQHPLAPSTAANTSQYNTSGKDYSGSSTLKRTTSQHVPAEASVPAAQTTSQQSSTQATSQTAAATAATASSASSNAVQGPWDAGMNRHSYIVRGNKFELPNEYKISKCIGTGAYGTVCAGTRNGQPVAVKRCPNLFKNLDDGKRVLREIKLLQFFHHDNVLSLKDLMPPRDRHRFNDVYMVTDLMNADLGKVLRSSQVLTDEHCQYFMYQMLRGLKHIHSANVMHRDLKPANVLVNWNCDMKLCDFGLSRGFDPEKAQDMTGYVVTRYYRPPELLMMCTQYTPAVDVWSAGCIFAEILNRRPLFKGKSYIHELSLVCDALGTPKEADLGWLTDPAALRYVKGLDSRQGRPIEELVPKLAGNTVARDFLGKMLVFDPTKRSSVSELLCHPYLAHLHDSSTEVDANSTFSWEHDRRSLKETELRNLFWDEICVFHPELDSIDAPCTNVY